jgi:tRNA-dihydrouridine synthase
MNFYDTLPKPFFILAPMDDVTDTVFRRIVAQTAAPDVYFTEFVNVDGLQSPGRAHLIKKLLHVAEEKSLVAQLWGKNPENFRKTAAELADPESELSQLAGGSFVGIDLNMGCPAKSEVNNGTCSALINNRPLALEIIKATQEGAAGKLPVSVKTRLGFSAVDMSWPELLLQQNLAMLTMHGRTRKEMSKVPAHWDLIAEVRQMRDDMGLKGKTLLVGNGDVRDRQHGLELAGQYDLDGIMVGRGIFTNPFCFAADAEPRWQALGREERLMMFRRHVELFAATWQHNERPIHTLNKFCKIYVSDFDGAKELREELMAANDTATLVKIITNALHTSVV